MTKRYISNFKTRGERRPTKGDKRRRPSRTMRRPNDRVILQVEKRSMISVITIKMKSWIGHVIRGGSVVQRFK
jgi:hypothetical protein